jgi:hypothetical protein
MKGHLNDGPAAVAAEAAGLTRELLAGAAG